MDILIVIVAFAAARHKPYESARAGTNTDPYPRATTLNSVAESALFHRLGVQA